MGLNDFIRDLKERENDLDREYEQVRLPDLVKLRDYINQAKGYNRTMAEFAAACGTLTPSSFSRIINKKFTKPLSIEVIQSIYKNADKDSGISYEMLMKANGYELKDRREKENENENDSVVTQKIKLRLKIDSKVLQIKNIIAEELFVRGFMIAQYPYGEFVKVIPDPRLSIPITFAFKIQSDDLKEPMARWNFAVMDSSHYTSDPQMKMFHDMEDCAGLFLRDIWYPQSLKDISQCFVFHEADYYEVFQKLLEGKRVNNRISIMLIDIDAGSVVKEEFIPRYDGKEQESLFSKKRMESDVYD